MMTKNFILVLLFLGVFTTLMPRSEGNELIDEIVSKLLSLWKSGQIEFLGHECEYQYKPTVRKFELRYKGKFWCPGWAPFSGGSLTQSRSGAVEHAIKDFVQKALDSKLVTESEVKAWL